MPLVVFPWDSKYSANSIEPDIAVISLENADPLLKYDVGDEVDAEHYSDGDYWRFDYPDLAGKKFVIKGSRIVSIIDVHKTLDGKFWTATRSIK